MRRTAMIKSLEIGHKSEKSGNFEMENEWQPCLLLPLIPGVGSKSHFFSESSHVSYQIIGKENILPSYTPSMGSKGQKIFFSEEGYVTYYQIKRKKVYSIVQLNCLTLCTHQAFWVGLKSQTLQLCR